MNHWCTFKDYKWVEENLPKLTELDLSDLQDTMFCDDDFFDGSHPTTDIQGNPSTITKDLETYEQLRSLKALWGRLEKLWVRHWGCDRLHNWKHRSDDYDKTDADAEIRSRRKAEAADLDVTSVIAECSKLRTLAIRGPSLSPALSRLWRPRRACAEDDGGSHAHFCTIVKGLEDNAPDSLRAIEFYQAEFAPRMVGMLRERTNIRRVSVSFGDVLRRFASGREADVRRDDAGEDEVENVVLSGSQSTARDNALCEYEKSTEGVEKGRFHESLAVELFPPQRTVRQLQNGETRDYLHQWANSQLPAERQPGPDYVLNDKSALVAEYLLTNRHESPVPGLNHFLIQLADAFNHCDSLSCNDQEFMNEIPVSPFSFISSGPHLSQSSLTGIFGDAKDDRSIQAFRLLHQRFGWAPLWDVDPLFDAHNFPWNVGIELPTLEGEDQTQTIARRLVAPILGALHALSHAGIPVRLLVGNRPRSCFPNAGLYWGATVVGHPADRDYASWLTIPVDDADLVRRDDGSSRRTTTPSATATVAETQPLRKEEEGKEKEKKGRQLALDAAAGADSVDTSTTTSMMTTAAATAAADPNTIAACADELVIRYQDWTGPVAEEEGEEEGEEKEKEEEHGLTPTPTPASAPAPAPTPTPTPAASSTPANPNPNPNPGPDHRSAIFLAREARGWQAWWRRAALRFTRLRRLRVRMPRCFDAYDSPSLAALLLLLVPLPPKRRGSGRRGSGRRDSGRRDSGRWREGQRGGGQQGDGGRWGRWGVVFGRGEVVGAGDGEGDGRAVERGEGGVEFIVREWARRGGARDVVFEEGPEEEGEEVRRSSDGVVAEEEAAVAGWWREMRVRQGRRLWREFVRVAEELGLLDERISSTVVGRGETTSTTQVKATPGDDDDDDDDYDDEGLDQLLFGESFAVSNGQLQVPETQPPRVLTPITPEKTPTPPPEQMPSSTPAPTPPPPLEAPEISLVSAEVKQSEDVAELKPSSNPKRPRKRGATPKKQSNAGSKRTRLSKDQEPEIMEGSSPPPPKKAKTRKKSRWERELELLQS
ncbi:uncharacterized protein BKCO1_2000058 [Diplodia corticola]|uniref:Uncharacterized protein n=1 Tax=Diplodia corticola TaxID=236234 RepID=A0A1J9S5C5_9PEZI|nr:uncharacterized protein BKCO1_2000058 [Diplodia corticola]OJD34821.1 hypothetical protein BKCO1_2000058 [Diplodia corticola]